jgi:hypothetical protein
MRESFVLLAVLKHTKLQSTLCAVLLDNPLILCIIRIKQYNVSTSQKTAAEPEKFPIF